VLPDPVQPAKGRLGKRNLAMTDSATENKPPQLVEVRVKR